MEDLRSFTAKLGRAGIDIVTPLDVDWYNAYIKEEKLPLKPIPSFGRKSGTVALLLGNSKALWPAFLEWLGTQPDPKAVAEPLDTFVTSSIEEALTVFGGKHDVFWPWEGGDRLVSMQRVAVCSALCYHDPETQLAIHPKFGAWVAFRALVVLDIPPAKLEVPKAAPERLGCLLSDDEKVAARAAMAAALRASDEANLCTQLHGANGMKTDVRLAWAALRDCVRVGRSHRYSEEQLTYHYTKEKAVLLQALQAHKSRRGEASPKPWLSSLSEVLLTFMLPVVLVLLAIYASGKRGLPGKPGDDMRLHSLAK